MPSLTSLSFVLFITKTFDRDDFLSISVVAVAKTCEDLQLEQCSEKSFLLIQRGGQEIIPQN